MPEMRFIEFPALSVDPEVGISGFASEAKCLIIFLTHDIKIIIYNSSLILFLSFYLAKRPFLNVIRCLNGSACDATSEI